MLQCGILTVGAASGNLKVSLETAGCYKAVRLGTLG